MRAEQDDRPDRRRDGPDEQQADEQDEHPRDRREAGLERDRRQDERGVRDAVAACRDDARGRRPDPAGHVLREQAQHLGLERGDVRQRRTELAQDRLPAEDEHEVVGGDRSRRGEQVGDVGVAQPRQRAVPGVAQLEREEHAERHQEDDLQRDQEPAPRDDRAVDVLQSLQHQLAVAGAAAAGPVTQTRPSVPGPP